MHFDLRACALMFAAIAPILAADPGPLTERGVIQAMTRVCDWQLENFRTQTINRSEKGDKAEAIREDGWIRGAAYAGVIAQYRVTHEQRYLDAALKWAAHNQWKLGPRARNADDQCVAQDYLELFELRRDPAMIADARRVFDQIAADPRRGPVAGWAKDANWAWCDALFMAPPALPRLARATGDPKYLALLSTLWWDTSEYLYDRAHHLYYRDANYFLAADGTGPRTPSGQKVFWARGNGWVLAGLARTLQYLPADFRDRPKIVEQFREMSARIASLQQSDGLWRSSLNEPSWYPARESSSSAMFCFAFAYGANAGLLDSRQYSDAARRAWLGLLTCVGPTGKIGWVQLTGHDPQPVFEGDTLDYAAGTFLLAGEQIIALLERENATAIRQ